MPSRCESAVDSDRQMTEIDLYLHRKYYVFTRKLGGKKRKLVTPWKDSSCIRVKYAK